MFDGAQFRAVVRGVRVKPGGDAILTVLIQDWIGNVGEGWKLTNAEGLVLELVAQDEVTGRRDTCIVSVERLRVRPGTGLEIQLRVPSERRDAALAISDSDLPKRFLLTTTATRTGSDRHPSGALST